MKTSRIGFGKWQQDDLQKALSIWGDDEVTRLVGGPFSEDQVLKRLHSEIITLELYGIQYWPIYDLNSGEHIGAAGLKWRNKDEKSYELGYYLKPSAWGKGYATEAGVAVANYAFSTLCARSLFGGHHPDNKASGIILTKIGFHFTHEELYLPTGLQHPSYCLNNPNKIEP